MSVVSRVNDAGTAAVTRRGSVYSMAVLVAVLSGLTTIATSKHPVVSDLAAGIFIIAVSTALVIEYRQSRYHRGGD